MKLFSFLVYLVTFFTLSPTLISSKSDELDTVQVAEQYYTDLASLIDYYAFSKNQPTTKRNNFGFKVIEEYSKSIKIFDVNEVAINILEMPEAERALFFEKWIISETKKMNEKFKLDHRGNWVKQIKKINKSFKRNIRYQSQKSLVDTLSNDPLSRIMLDLEPKQSRIKYKSKSSGFWVETFETYRDQFYLKGGEPRTTISQNFVDSIRDSIQRGRILVALPDGDYTKLPGVLFRESHLIDVGHVAIIKINSNEVPVIVSDTFSMTIGTNFSKDMHHERLSHDWTKVHGRAYLLQVFEEKWFKRNGEYKLETIDVDNEQLYDEARNHMDSKYCGIIEIFKAKLYAPNRFICSSAAWYYAKNTRRVELGIPYKRSIWPSDILKSNFTRVVGKTW